MFLLLSAVQFETMRRSDQVKEFRCFYNTQTRKFYSVVMLGK
jgi:hypothetical protein